MPYSGSEDESLPGNVKALPIDLRKQWVAVWNSSYSNCKSEKTGGGAGSDKDCEGVAFKFANGVLKRRQKETVTMEEEEEGEKAGAVLAARNKAKVQAMLETMMGLAEDAGMSVDEMVAMIREKKKEEEVGEKVGYENDLLAEAPIPAGGAKSFAEWDKIQASKKKECAVKDQVYLLQDLLQNIWGDDEVTVSQKVAQSQSLLSELPDRVANPPAVKELEEDEEVGKSIITRVKELLFGEKVVSKTEEGTAYPASDFAYVPDPQTPSTWKLRLAEVVDGQRTVTVAQVGRAIAAFSPEGFRGNKVQIPSADVGAVKAKIRDAWKKVNPDKGDEEMPSHIKEMDDEEVSSFYLTKEGDSYRWLSVVTNKWEDRQGEVFTEESHREYERWVTETKQYPELRLWHIPGTRIGQADFVGYADGFMVHSGTIDLDRVDVAEALTKLPDKLGVSHGYRYRVGDMDSDEKAYKRYRTFEDSVLPLNRAANPYTLFTLGGEDIEMGFSEQKREFLVKTFGEERTKGIEETLAKMSSDLASKGIRWKELEEVLEQKEEVKDVEAEGQEEETVEEGRAEKVDLTPVIEGIKAIGSGLEVIKAKMEKQDEIITAIGARLDQLEKSDEVKMAELMSPKREVVKAGVKATDKDSNVITEEQAREMGVKTAEEEAKETGSDTPVSPYFDQLMKGLGFPK